MEDTLLLDRRTQSLVEEYVPEGEILEGLVGFFSIFADATRVRILSALAITEMCVTDISRVLDINQTTVSHQLRYLKNVGIVKASRLGKVIFYSLKNDTVNDVLLKGVEFLLQQLILKRSAPRKIAGRVSCSRQRLRVI